MASRSQRTDRQQGKGRKDGTLHPDQELPIIFLDPGSDDEDTDPAIALSQRKLARLICMAAETGSRFSRRNQKIDPVYWMYQPQAVFSGRAAIQACTDRIEYQRGMIVHGLALSGLTLPGQIDALLDREDFIGDSQALRVGHNWSSTKRGALKGLFTASISDVNNHGRLLIFVAIVADDEGEVWLQLRDRYGERAANLASIRRGFDPSEPIAIALVSEPLADTLQLVANAPSSLLAEGLDVQLESRFAN